MQGGAGGQAVVRCSPAPHASSTFTIFLKTVCRLRKRRTLKNRAPRASRITPARSRATISTLASLIPETINPVVRWHDLQFLIKTLILLGHWIKFKYTPQHQALIKRIEGARSWGVNNYDTRLRLPTIPIRGSEAMLGDTRRGVCMGVDKGGSRGGCAASARPHLPH